MSDVVGGFDACHGFDGLEGETRFFLLNVLRMTLKIVLLMVF